MRAGIFINTPSQYHFYKNVIKRLEDDGHQTFICARDYGETYDLLREDGVPYFSFSTPTVSKAGKVLALPSDVLNAYRYLRGQKVDVVTGFGIYNALTASLLRVPDVIFNDTEPLLNPLSYSLQVKLCLRLTGAFLTPATFRERLGSKQIVVNGYKEIAYLHPKYYAPDPGVPALLGVRPGEEYVVVRFNAFDALHDVGKGGFDDRQKVRLVRVLERYAKVFICSEVKLPGEIEGQVLQVPKNRLHDVLCYAKLLVTDTSTIATEAAMLGTPAVRCNGFVGDRDSGNYLELEGKYGLIFNFRDPDAAIEKAVSLVQEPGLKARWSEKRDAFLRSNIDLAGFMAWFLETYPESRAKMHRDPAVQKAFA